jgi:hypothetical protein
MTIAALHSLVPNLEIKRATEWKIEARNERNSMAPAFLHCFHCGSHIFAVESTTIRASRHYAVRFT